MRQRNLKAVLVILCAAALSACGGGGDAETDTPTPDAGAAGATASNPATTPPTTTPGAPGATPGATAVGGAAATATSTTLPEAEGNEVSGLGSLNTSGLFAAKAQFGKEEDTSLGATAGQLGAVGSTVSTPSVADTTPKPVAVAYTAARISLNGQVYPVTQGGIFPKTEQTFRVRSINANSVVVELVAGEFSNGSNGITLTKGKRVPLVNQDEGLNFVLKLLSTSAGEGSGSSFTPSPATIPSSFPSTGSTSPVPAGSTTPPVTTPAPSPAPTAPMY